MAFQSYRNRLLVASPSMKDPSFTETVVYLCEHTKSGAMGFVVNRPVHPEAVHAFSEMIFKQLDIPAKTVRLFEGGPVGLENVFMLHRPVEPLTHSIALTGNVMLSTAKVDFEKIFRTKDPVDYVVVLGYCGWHRGQLEEELSGTDWLVAPADESLLFDEKPEGRYAKALASIGINESDLALWDTGSAKA